MEQKQFIKKKCKRYNIPGHAHGLTFSCYRNQKFLLSGRTCQWLIESIERARKKHNFSLWAFVFMPDHVHLLIQPMDEEYNISNILKDIKTDTARKVIKYLKENKPSGLSQLSTGQKYRKYRFWQKGGGYGNTIQFAHTTRSVATTRLLMLQLMSDALTVFRRRQILAGH